jgi:hypothetical protein
VCVSVYVTEHQFMVPLRGLTLEEEGDSENAIFDKFDITKVLKINSHFLCCLASRENRRANGEEKREE